MYYNNYRAESADCTHACINRFLHGGSSGGGATVLDESTGVPSSAATAGKDNPYDYVEWKASTKHESAALCEEIGLSTNLAYGRV